MMESYLFWKTIIDQRSPEHYSGSLKVYKIDSFWVEHRELDAKILLKKVVDGKNFATTEYFRDDGPSIFNENGSVYYCINNLIVKKEVWVHHTEKQRVIKNKKLLSRKIESL